MDKKQVSPKLSQAEPLPTQEEQVAANPPSRKRHINSDSDAEAPTKRARLTQKNLALFDKMGKKKTLNPTDDSKSIKTTSTTTSGFADKAYKNHILPQQDSERPINIDDFRRRDAAPRDTASPPESAYERYADRIEEAGNEATVVIESSKLLKEYDDKGYRRAFNRSFTNTPPNAGYNNGLSAPQPDFVEGLKKGEFRPLPVADYVPGAVLYGNDPYSVTLPHVAGEWKGPDGSMREAELQSAYDGAALVHARNQALAYMGQSDPPGHAAITTFTTDGTNLNMYAHYAAPSEEDKDILEYHQYKYASANIKDSYQGHKDGRKSLRNAQDYAKEQAYALRDDLKEHWKQSQQHRNTLPSVAEDTHLPVPDSQANPYEDTNLYQTSHDTSTYRTGYETASYQQASYEADTQGTAQHDDEAAYKVVDVPQPKRQSSSKHSSSKHSSSKSSHQAPSSDGHKRKASQPSPLGSEHASKHKNYWKLDSKSGCYYHKHSDGTITWFEGEEDEQD